MRVLQYSFLQFQIGRETLEYSRLVRQRLCLGVQVEYVSVRVVDQAV